MVAVLANELHQIAYRDDVCAHLAIDGACPRGPREVLLAEPFAARLGLAVGDTVALRGRTEIPPVPMTVVGRYRALNADDPYWGIQTQGSERLADVGIFTPLATFASLRPNQIELSVDLTATPAAYRDRDPQAMTLAAEQGALRLGAEGIHVSSGLRALADRLGEERRLVVNGVVIGVTELLVVCWLALFLAVRRTAETRRADIGLLKLRGARRRDLWRFVAGQSLLPLAVGGLVGYALGPPVAEWLAGPADAGPVGAGLGDPLTLTAAAVGLAVVGAAIAALAAERRTLTESVAALGRRVGRPRTGRRQFVLDAIVVVLALAGAYQAAAGAGQGVALVAPLLLALAVGVLAVRLAPVAAGRIGANALHAGRLGAALAAHHLARRAGAASVLGVVVVTVAVGTATTLTWSSAASARAQRAALRGRRAAGAHRPGGQPAPTAAGGADRRSGRPVGHGGGTHGYRGRTRPRGRRRATGGGGAPAGRLRAARLRRAGDHPAPGRVRADHRTGGQSHRRRELHCGRTPGRRPGRRGRTAAGGVVRPAGHRPAHVRPAGRLCHRLPAGVAVGVSTASTVDITGAVTVHSVSNVDGALADRTRWRAGVADAAAVPELTAGPDGLRIAPGRGPAVPQLTAFVADAPTPLPVVRGGDIAVDRSQPRSAVVGGDVLPVRVAATGARLPGAADGLLADLDYADRLSPDAGDRVTTEVWLGRDAPTGIDTALTSAGLTLLGERGIAGRQSELDARGPATALRFLVIVALVAIAMALVVSPWRPRPNGARGRGARRPAPPGPAGPGGTAGRPRRLPGAGTGGGRAGPGRRVLLVALMPAPLPAFADAFVAPAPPPVPVLPLAAAALACLAGFAVVGVAAGVGLAVAARRLSRGSAWSD